MNTSTKFLIAALCGLAAAVASAETYTLYSYQCKTCPVPPIKPALVDNKSTYPQVGSSGSNLKRYLYRGEIQACPTGGTTQCSMTWGKSYSKAVAHGTKIDVNFTNKLTDKLSGSVTLGYSLTVTTTETLTWANTVWIQPGWSARPVSYLWRKRGNGDVKNAFIFKSRRKVHSACRPSGGCYAYYDDYVRESGTKVGVWLADVALNNGDPTNSWNTFQGATDPNTYIFD